MDVVVQPICVLTISPNMAATLDSKNLFQHCDVI